MKSNDTPCRPWKLLAVLVGLVVPLTLFVHAAAAAGPGALDGNAAPSAAASANSLTQFKSIVGQVVLSEDACGTNTPSPTSSCTVDIEKPSASATVREADLFCATIPANYTPKNGDVTVNGVPVAWDQLISYQYFPGAGGVNARDDVTAIVKPVGDAALPGLVSFTITENPTLQYDGCALKVIWDDPTTTVNSILIFFGHQESAGDTFVINFAQPLDANAFLQPLEFSLGISFGFQPGGQFSQVDVNGMRLTTSAGGQDDGAGANGALITLGGTGDTTANPPPLAPPVTPSVPDDELYDLRPFVNIGDTSMTIFTLNPSNDDNIFLANVFLPNVRIVTPEPVPTTLTLEPPTATNPVGTKHCVTATVRDQFGDPMNGVTVRFSVSGSVTTSGSATTDANGEAQFCYTGPAFPGADKIHAYADTDKDNIQDAGEPFGDATKEWVLPVSTPGCEVKITNGGWIIATNRDESSFGGNAKVGATVGDVSGNEEYQDHGPAQPMNLHGNVMVVVCTSLTQATIYGTATVDGAGSFLYRLNVEDNGDGGKGVDKYWILVANGYDSGNQTLKGGNVQIHKS
jgi:Big-like domain-containing protein